MFNFQNRFFLVYLQPTFVEREMSFLRFESSLSHVKTENWLTQVI